MAAWHADAVRVPLNEDCWLGINGQPSVSGQSATAYRTAIEAWVSSLDADGIYAVLDLHWSAPGTNVADGQRPMPDDHSVAFWQSVASTFASDHAVVFDAFNEPYSPLTDGDSTLGVSLDVLGERGLHPAGGQGRGHAQRRGHLHRGGHAAAGDRHPGDRGHPADPARRASYSTT